MVSLGVNPIVPPCFAMEVRELAKPTSGKREAAQGKKGIANRLRY